MSISKVSVLNIGTVVIIFPQAMRKKLNSTKNLTSEGTVAVGQISQVWRLRKGL